MKKAAGSLPYNREVGWRVGQKKGWTGGGSDGEVEKKKDDDRGAGKRREENRS